MKNALVRKLALLLLAEVGCIATLPGAPCIDDSDCRTGQCSVDGYCTSSSLNDDVADPVQEQDAGPRRDGGVAADAGEVRRADAGELDGGAGADDAGDDAARADAGGPGDSGAAVALDAGDGGGVGDGGRTDAGLADSGPLDAGGFDGGPDAGAAVCGDGVVALGETCDVGPDGGGACVDCQTQPGFACVAEPSICVPEAQARSVSSNAFDGVTDALAELSPEPGKTVVIEVTGGPYDTIGNQDGKGRIVIVGNPTATFTGSGADAFKAKNDTQLVLKNITVAASSNTFLVKVEGTGATAVVEDSMLGPTGGSAADLKSGGTLVVRRSVLFGAAVHGIVTEGSGNALLLENSFVVENGVDGVRIIAGNTASVVFATIADNGGVGVSCSTSSVDVTASLVSGNLGGDTSGACVFDASMAGADAGVAGFAGGDGGVEDRFRLTQGSSCYGAVTDAGALPVEDYDRERRPQGAGVECGADELP